MEGIDVADPGLLQFESKYCTYGCTEPVPFAYTVNVAGTPAVTGGNRRPLLYPPPGVGFNDCVPVRAVSAGDATDGPAAQIIHAPTPDSNPSEYALVVADVPAAAVTVVCAAVAPAAACGKSEVSIVTVGAPAPPA